MINKNLVDTCMVLIALALIFLLFGILGYKPVPVIVDEIEDFAGFTAKDMIVPLPKVTVYENETPPHILDALENSKEIKRKMGEVVLTGSRLVLKNEYRVFLTAYCAEECGWNYWTSSGTYCHRASEIMRYDEPTTCAIDLHYFSYGTMFYVPSEDRVYIAEDTGAFRGMWLDLYQDDMSDVVGYNTRYEYVYTVEIEEYTVSSSHYHVQDMIQDMLNDYQRDSI